MKRGFSGQKGHVVDFLFTLALFCVFAVSALLVVIIGANVYENTVNGMTQNYDSRTSLTYVAQKVRQNDASGAVRVETIDGSPALVLRQTVGERQFETWIYAYDGYLREVFAAQGTAIKPSDGQKIMEQGSFEVEKEGSLLSLRVSDSHGKSEEMKLFLSCEN